ncbi:hypothetical protein Y032_0010g895 [Ancylostoma ceylanicum]|nr:hypothetical protein Y032_0010g895 [Ancylostoma ceylanicum]
MKRRSLADAEIGQGRRGKKWVAAVLGTRKENKINDTKMVLLYCSGPTIDPKLKIMDFSENFHTVVIQCADHEVKLLLHGSIDFIDCVDFFEV